MRLGRPTRPGSTRIGPHGPNRSPERGVFRSSLLLALIAGFGAAALAPAGSAPLPQAPSCPIFPVDNVWHADVSALPLHPHGPAWLASMGGPTVRLHPDFGPSDTSQPYGIPFTTVAGDHRKVSVDFEYAEESDPGPYPFGPETPIEGGSDRHALMIDRDNCRLYELFAAQYSDGGSTAGSGAVFDLRSNALRPETWTSADAAGLPILAGLVRRDEVEAGVIDHAIRMTASRTDRRFVWPARHQAGAASDPTLPPMGAWFRLRASFDVARFRPDTQVILRAMQRHGMVLADNGSDWFFTGASEPGWDPAMLEELKSVTAGEFEAVDMSPLMADPHSGQVRGAPAPAAPAGAPAEATRPPARRASPRRSAPRRAPVTTQAAPATSTSTTETTEVLEPLGEELVQDDEPRVSTRVTRSRRQLPLEFVALALLLAVIGAWIGYVCVLASRAEPD